MSVKITRNMAAIQAKIKAGNSMMIPAVTESVIEYGNVFVPEDQGTLKDSALIASRPQDGLAIWDTPYAKRRYYTGPWIMILWRNIPKRPESLSGAKYLTRRVRNTANMKC